MSLITPVSSNSPTPYTWQNVISTYSCSASLEQPLRAHSPSGVWETDRPDPTDLFYHIIYACFCTSFLFFLYVLWGHVIVQWFLYITLAIWASAPTLTPHFNDVPPPPRESVSCQCQLLLSCDGCVRFLADRNLRREVGMGRKKFEPATETSSQPTLETTANLCQRQQRE